MQSNLILTYEKDGETIYVHDNGTCYIEYNIDE